MRASDPTVDFAGVVCKRETDAALLCEIEGEDIWIPKSQIHDDSEVYEEGHSGTLIVSEWIAKQKNLI